MQFGAIQNGNAHVPAVVLQNMSLRFLRTSFSILIMVSQFSSPALVKSGHTAADCVLMPSYLKNLKSYLSI